MSIDIMKAVWANSKATGSERLVLLALADYANDTGKAWPALEKLAKKCRLSRSRAQRLTHALERLGELRIIVGGGRTSNTYWVLTPRVAATGVGNGTAPTAATPRQPSPAHDPNHQGTTINRQAARFARPVGKKLTSKYGAWWKSDEGVLAMAEEVDVKPYPGETFPALKERVFQRIDALKRLGGCG